LSGKRDAQSDITERERQDKKSQISLKALAIPISSSGISEIESEGDNDVHSLGEGIWIKQKSVGSLPRYLGVLGAINGSCSGHGREFNRLDKKM